MKRKLGIARAGPYDWSPAPYGNAPFEFTMLVGRQRFILEGLFAHKIPVEYIKDVTAIAYMLQGSGCSDTGILH